MGREQGGVYPQVDTLVSELRPFVGATWPENNYTYHGVVADAYLGARQGVYACPGYNRVRGEFQSDAHPPPVLVVARRGSYGYNSLGAPRRNGKGLSGSMGASPDGGVPAAGVWMPMRESQIICPSDMIAMSDSVFWPYPSGPSIPSGLLDLAPALSPNTWLPVTDAMRAVQQRHGGRWSVGFCDGHVENMRTTDLFNRTNYTVMRRWNNDHLPYDGSLPKP